MFDGLGWAGPPFPSSIKLQKNNQILNHSKKKELVGGGTLTKQRGSPHDSQKEMISVHKSTKSGKRFRRSNKYRTRRWSRQQKPLSAVSHILLDLPVPELKQLVFGSSTASP
jgi:hypothetical protein